MLTLAFGMSMTAMVSKARLPPPLSPADGVTTFTYDSVQRRLPLIAEAVVENNEFPAALVADLRALGSEIARGDPLQPLTKPSDEWAAALAPRATSR